MKPRTKVEEALGQAEAAHSHEPERAEIIARARRFKASWFELAESLTEQKRSEQFKKWGFASFDDYCRRELHLRRETAEKLTGSFTFLRSRAPEVLARNGSSAPIPSYQAVDFLRRVEETDAPAETVREIRHHVLDEGTSLPKLSRLYREVVFPTDANADEQDHERQRSSLRQTIDRLVELLAIAKDRGMVPTNLAAEVEEPLARLARLLQPE